MKVRLAAAMTLTAFSAYADSHRADTLFEEGQRALSAGRTSEACRLFEESYREDKAPGSLLNLAVCHEREEKRALAWEEFSEAESLCQKLGQDERAAFARKKRAELAKSIGFVEFSPEPGVLRVDGTPVPSREHPLPLDPGLHTLTLERPPAPPVVHRFIVLSGGVETVRIPVPKVEPQDKPTTQERRDLSTRDMGVLAFGSASALGLGLGTYFGLRTFSGQAESRGHCDGALCDETGVRLRESASTSATLSTTFFALGLASGAFALYFYLSGKGESRLFSKGPVLGGTF